MISRDDDGVPVLSNECTLAELGQWVKETAEIYADIWTEAVEPLEMQRDTDLIIEEAEAQQSLGMKWTRQRVAVLLMLADLVKNKHSQSDDVMDAFVRVSMTMLAGCPEALQDCIEIDLATSSLRLKEGVSIEIEAAS